MREIWARRIALLAGGLVVALAVAFAFHQNPPRREPPPPPVPPVEPPVAPTAQDQALIEAGRAVYAEQACARCHSIGGRGNPRSPLDGVGARLGDEEILGWITPSATTGQGFRSRHANLKLTAAQRDALLAYLRSLRNGAPAAK